MRLHSARLHEIPVGKREAFDTTAAVRVRHGRPDAEARRRGSADSGFQVDLRGEAAKGGVVDLRGTDADPQRSGQERDIAAAAPQGDEGGRVPRSDERRVGYGYDGRRRST